MISAEHRRRIDLAISELLGVRGMIRNGAVTDPSGLAANAIELAILALESIENRGTRGRK